MSNEKDNTDKERRRFPISYVPIIIEENGEIQNFKVEKLTDEEEKEMMENDNE